LITWTAAEGFEETPKVALEPQWEAWSAIASREASRTKQKLQNLKNKPEKAATSGQGAPTPAHQTFAGLDPDFEAKESLRILRAGGQKNGVLRHLVSFHAVRRLGQQRFEPVRSLESLIKWTDSWGSTAAHHLAFMGLPRAYETLRSYGASVWIPNNGKETAAALADGFCELRADGYPQLAPEDFEVHRACFHGGFLSLLGSVEASAETLMLIRKVLSCPPTYMCSDERLSGIKLDLLSGDVDKALATCKSLVAISVLHAKPYLALAMLHADYGGRAARIELDAYLVQLVRSDSEVIDPIFFYAHYYMWIADGRPRAIRERVRASNALTVFRRFKACAAEWLTPQDDVDVRLRNEGVGLDPTAEDEDTDDELDVPGPDDPESQWMLAKEQENLTSKSMDALMSLAGLKSVKHSAIKIVKEVLLKQQRPGSVDATVAMNLLFVGNPGCGKTTVAQLISRAMYELGYRSNPDPIETSAQAILKMKDPVNDFVKMVQAAKGGTMFIDEAYRFSPNKGKGSPNESNYILDYLLETVEDKSFRETTTFILAGYKDEIEDLLAYNPGFASRFSCEFNFTDFSENQIRAIFLKMIKDRGFRLESKKECSIPLAKVVAQRIARYAGKKGFGNAREVRNKVEEIIGNQTQRLGTRRLKGQVISDGEYKTLNRADTIGARPDFSSSPLLKQLNSLIGLRKVKEAIKKLVDLQVQNYDREKAGQRPALISLHRVFYGNPGDAILR
jgi:SpoVK/Ycf46/Vps4 family AAA+-type ATPase